MLKTQSTGCPRACWAPPTKASPQATASIEIRMKLSSGVGPARINFATVADPVIGGSKRPDFTSAAENQVHRYYIDMSQHPSWKGLIAQLRLDPTDASGANSEIDYIRVTANPIPSVPAPTNLGAAAQSPGKVLVSWSDNAATETSYTVERSLDGNNWTVIAAGLPPNSQSFLDAGLAPGTLYFYRAQALDIALGAQGQSPYSSPAAQVATPLGWEFNSSGNSEGWQAAHD